jgi:hypothetical protein
MKFLVTLVIFRQNYDALCEARRAQFQMKSAAKRNVPGSASRRDYGSYRHFWQKLESFICFREQNFPEAFL